MDFPINYIVNFPEGNSLSDSRHFFSSLRHGRFQNPIHPPWRHGAAIFRQVNALMSDHLGASRDLTVDTVQRIEQSMKRALVVLDAKHGRTDGWFGTFGLLFHFIYGITDGVVVWNMTG